MFDDIRQKLHDNREGVVMVTGMVIGCGVTYLVMRQPPMSPTSVRLIADPKLLKKLVETQHVVPFMTPSGLFKLVPPTAV